MTVEEIGKKAKKVYGEIRDNLVQEDNPNSPHLVFQRMNQNMLGDSGAPASPKHQKKEGNEEPVVTDADKRRKRIFSPESFEKVVWGDEK